MLVEMDGRGEKAVDAANMTFSQLATSTKKHTLSTLNMWTEEK